MIYDSKTNCFGIKDTIFSTRRDKVFQTKTICFGTMMLYDAFAKRVILYNKLIVNNLASNMTLLLNN